MPLTTPANRRRLFASCDLEISFWGAHASRVPFSASRRKPCSSKLFFGGVWVVEESGATPDSTRGTRVLPFSLVIGPNLNEFTAPTGPAPIVKIDRKSV